jgi:hypothetical protein
MSDYSYSAQVNPNSAGDLRKGLITVTSPNLRPVWKSALTGAHAPGRDSSVWKRQIPESA